MNNHGIKVTIKTGVSCNITWLRRDNNFKYVILDKNTSDGDTDDFFAEMFNYMNINSGEDINEGISNMLVRLKDRFAAKGGLMFYNGDKVIYPQCCCGLEQLAEEINAIERKEGFWLGHDPMPYQLYSDNELTVWSANLIESNTYGYDRFSVSFSYVELPALLESVIKDCYEFLTIVFRNRLISLGADERSTDKLTSAFLKAFGYITENGEVKLQRHEHRDKVELPDKNRGNS